MCLGETAAEEARKLGVRRIYVSGGAAVNRVILKAIENSSGFEVSVNRRIPPGDGGIAVGQVYIAGRLECSRS